jgi:hypothetical protein
MPAEFQEAPPRNFNPMSIPRLSDKARRAVSAGFEAMSTWRGETVDNGEKNSEQVINKMAAAAQALGWPEQIVDTVRTLLQGITKKQMTARKARGPVGGVELGDAELSVDDVGAPNSN